MKFSLDSKFFTVSGKIVDMMVLSLLWLVLCLPVLTVIPASIALYYTAAKVLRKGTGSVFPEFFHAFRENLKQGILLDLIYLAISGTLLGIRAFYQWKGVGTPLGSVYFVFLLVAVALLGGVTFYLLPVLSRFSVSLTGALRMAAYFTSRNLGTVIPMLITFAAFCAAVYLIPYFLIILPGFYAYLMTKSVEKTLREYIRESLPNPEEHAGMWYMEP